MSQQHALEKISWLNPKELKPHPKNRNKHPKEQIERLAKILRYQGFRKPIVVSNQSGFVVEGHGRIEAALKNKWDRVPVSYQDFEDETQEYAHLTADNAIALWAELDMGGINADTLELGPFDTELLGIQNWESIGEDAYAGDESDAKTTLAERFGVPPFSVLDARQGYWQNRKRAWLSLGIQSELGRGGGGNKL